MTIDRDSDIARAYRKARRYGYGTGALRPAGLALAEARKSLATVAQARAAYEAANPQTADAQAPGALPIDSAEGHAARSAYVNARARAGLYASGTGWQTWPDTDSAFRDTVAAHDVPGAGIDHNGWYDNPHSESARDGSGLIWGVVCQLPGKGGCARYVAGWQQGGTDGGPCLDLTRIYSSPAESSWDSPDAQAEAARAADSMAEAAAEAEREYQEAWDMGRQWAELGETVAETRTRTLELLRQNRESGGSRDLPAIHATIRDAVCKAWRDICEARAERESLASGLYWSRHNLTPLEAFAEGAGLDMAEARGLCS